MSGYASAPARATQRPERVPVEPSTIAPAAVRVLFNSPQYPTAIRDAELDLVNQFQYPFNTVGKIQLSGFQFTDLKLAEALLNAADDGVTVQVVLDGKAGTNSCEVVLMSGGCFNKAYAELAKLNTLHWTDPSTWLRTCDGVGPGSPTPIAGAGPGCVGQMRNHNKFLLVSSGEPGTSAYTSTVFQTSSNSTASSYQSALNNAIEVTDQPQLYADYQEYFAHLAGSYQSTGPPSIRHFVSTWGYSLDTDAESANDLATWSFPQQSANDPVADILQGVGNERRCLITNPVNGDPKHTRVEIAMSVVGGRPLLMAQLSRIAHAGCVVRVVYSRMSARDHGILAHAGVGLTRLCIANPDNVSHPTQYVHSKYMLIEGDDSYFGADKRIVYTGSENWTNIALGQSDDRMVQYVEPARPSPVAFAYARNFTNLRALAMAGTPATVGCGTDE